MKKLLFMALSGLVLMACGEPPQPASVFFALDGSGFYGDSVSRFTLRLYEEPPQSSGAKPYLEYKCRAYENDGFHVSGIEPGVNYTVLFRAYSDESCTELSHVALRGGIRVEEDARDQGRYYLALLEVGAASPLADPAFSNLGQLNGAPCDVLSDTCAQYFPSVSQATCSADSRRCRVFCDDDAGCAEIHAKAVCDDDGVETYCRFPDAFPLNNAEARGFGAAVELSDGGVGWLGGLSSLEGGLLRPASVPIESFEARSILFDAPLETGYVPTGFGGTVRIGKDSFATIGGLKALGMERDDAGQIAFRLCDGAGPFCGFQRTVEMYDFRAGRASSSQLVRALALPVVWRLHDAAVVLFGGVGFAEDLPTLSGDGLLCSFGTFDPATADLEPLSCQSDRDCLDYHPNASCHDGSCGFRDTERQSYVSCQPYDNVLNGPRVGHAGVCIESSGETQISCDQYLVLGGNLPGGNTSAADLMVIEASSGYSIKQIALETTVPGSPANNLFGARPAVTSDGWFSIGGAPFSPADLAVQAPSAEVFRYEVSAADKTITPHEVPVSGLPTTASGGAMLARVFHQVITIEDPDGDLVVVLGGVDHELRATNNVVVLRDKGGALEYVRDFELTHARFGHQVTAFDNPILPRGFIVSGGFTFSGSELEPVYGSEVILLPLDG
jgi:hypothetical protein